MSTRRGRTSATDVYAVVLDDALLDRIGSGSQPDASGDPAVQLLADWRADCLAAPVPAPPRRGVLTRALRSGTAAKAIRTSWRAVASIAASLTLLVGTTTAVGARSAEPGDVLWPVAEWLYADYAASVSAAFDAQRSLSRARAALNDNDLSGARLALSAARQALPQIREQHRRREVQSELDRLAGAVGDPPPPDSPADPVPPTDQAGAVAAESRPVTRSAQVRSAETGELSGAPLGAASQRSRAGDQPPDAVRLPAGAERPDSRVSPSGAGALPGPAVHENAGPHAAIGGGAADSTDARAQVRTSSPRQADAGGVAPAAGTVATRSPGTSQRSGATPSTGRTESAGTSAETSHPSGTAPPGASTPADPPIQARPLVPRPGGPGVAGPGSPTTAASGGGPATAAPSGSAGPGTAEPSATGPQPGGPPPSTSPPGRPGSSAPATQPTGSSAASSANPGTGSPATSTAAPGASGAGGNSGAASGQGKPSPPTKIKRPKPATPWLPVDGWRPEPSRDGGPPWAGSSTPETSSAATVTVTDTGPSLNPVNPTDAVTSADRGPSADTRTSADERVRPETLPEVPTTSAVHSAAASTDSADSTASADSTDSADSADSTDNTDSTDSTPSTDGVASSTAPRPR